jgi:hypothetical protein
LSARSTIKLAPFRCRCFPPRCAMRCGTSYATPAIASAQQRLVLRCLLSWQPSIEPRTLDRYRTVSDLEKKVFAFSRQLHLTFSGISNEKRRCSREEFWLLARSPMRTPTAETRPKPSPFRCLYHRAIHLQRRNERSRRSIYFECRALILLPPSCTQATW